MAINEVIFPTTPSPVAGDWEKAINLIAKSFQNINDPLQIDGSNVPQGAVFQSGGHVYHADADTAITGTSSDYVKLTVSGTTLVPTFVASLTGVTWNKVWNGYYDTLGNLYVFDEVKAILAGTLSGGYSKFSELWMNNAGQSLKATDDVAFNDVEVGNDLILGDVVAGTTLFHRLADVSVVTSTSVVIGVYSLMPFSGTIRTDITLSRNNVATTVYGRIYKNGVAYGTEFSGDPGYPGTLTFNENISVTKYDKIAISVRESYSGAASYAKATVSLNKSIPVLTYLSKSLSGDI